MGVCNHDLMSLDKTCRSGYIMAAAVIVRGDFCLVVCAWWGIGIIFQPPTMWTWPRKMTSASTVRIGPHFKPSTLCLFVLPVEALVPIGLFLNCSSDKTRPFWKETKELAETPLGNKEQKRPLKCSH